MPGVDPDGDVTALVKSAGYEDVTVKAIRRNPYSANYTCDAIVQTSSKSFVYNFQEVEDAPGHIERSGQVVSLLVSPLPDGVSFDNVGPYTMGADSTIMRYAILSTDAVTCKKRPGSWRERIVNDIIVAIPPNRRDLLDAFHRQLDIERTMDRRLVACRGSDMEDKLRLGDELLAGTRQVWDRLE